MQGLSLPDVEVLRVRLLGFSTTPPSRSDEPPVEEEDDLPSSNDGDAFQTRDPGDVLRRIADWWRKHGAQWTQVYNRKVYSGIGGEQKLVEKLRSQQPAERRNGWLMLLTLAACQRYGRQGDEQRSGFLRRLQAEGKPPWWQVVAGDPNKTEPDDWIRILNQWFDLTIDQDSYRLWLGSFSTLYQLHRHGDTYQHLLSRAHEFPPEQFTLDALLSPRANPVLRGAGGRFDAPPLARALGIGASWALRELVRLKVIREAPHVARYCYVPHLRTRELLRKLGAPEMGEDFSGSHGDRSRLMAQYLYSHLGEDSCFDGAFDLPLYLVATDPEAYSEALE